MSSLSSWKISIGVLALAASASWAGEREVGRERYLEHCAKCHGVVTERRVDARASGQLLPVVMLPLGPNLTGVYGRAAGTVKGFRYSNAFVAAAPGLVWNDENLDRWLTDSQSMIPGSYMFMKLDTPTRRDVIGYLRAYASRPPQ